MELKSFSIGCIRMSEDVKNKNKIYNGLFYSMLRPSIFKTENFEIPAVILGERGRGRQRKIIPVYSEEIENFEPVVAHLTRSGKSYTIKKSSDSKKQNGSFIAIVSGRGVYTRNTRGLVYKSTNDDRVTLLTTAYGAYGIAGNIGRWYDYLIHVRDASDHEPVFLRVRPAGGSHKEKRYWLVFTGQKVSKYTDEESEIECLWQWPTLNDMLTVK